MEVVRIGGEDAGWGTDPNGQAMGPAEHPAGPIEDTAVPPELPIVLVTWRDAWFDFDEPDPDDPRADYLVTTVGFLIRQGPRFVSVAQEVLPDGDGFRAVTHIPTAIVQTISPLEIPGGTGVGDLAAP